MEMSCSTINQVFAGVTASFLVALSLFGQSRTLLEFVCVCGLARKKAAAHLCFRISLATSDRRTVRD